MNYVCARFNDDDPVAFPSVIESKLLVLHAEAGGTRLNLQVPRQRWNSGNIGEVAPTRRARHIIISCRMIVIKKCRRRHAVRSVAPEIDSEEILTILESTTSNAGDVGQEGDGIVMLVRPQSPNAKSPMLATLAPSVTLARLMQFSNALIPILATPLPIVALVSREQYPNASLPILVTLLGIVTFARPHCQNALSPMLVTLVPIVTLAKLKQDSNIWSPILVMPLPSVMLPRLVKL